MPEPEPTPSILEGYGADLAAVVLVGVAIVGAFGVYGHSAGPVGSGLTDLLGWLFGLLRYVAPPALAGCAGWLVMSQHGSRDVDESVDVDRSEARRVIGAVLLALVVAGLLHLVLRDAKLHFWPSISGAGGLLGALLGEPLRKLISSWGAATVLVLGGVFGVSLVTNRSVLSLARSLGRGTRPAMGAIGGWLSDLFQVGGSDSAESTAEAPTAELFDQDSAGQGLPAKKIRKKAEVTPTVPPRPPEPTVFLPSNVEPTQLEIALPPGADGSSWKLPPISLLSRSASQEVDTEAVAARGRQLEGALAEHGVTTRLVGMVVGPTVTRYELELGVGVKVNAVVNLQKDIAYAMASPDVRIMAPIPGKQAIGVEVPNSKRQIIAIADILTSAEAQRATHPLEVAVGRDIEGHNVLVNLATMPHVLIAGQTGAGKSSCINSIMTSILMRATPDQVRLILVDPKRVELTQYNRVPHLLTQVVTDPKKAANALKWAVDEMERRYELLEKVGFRDISGYNASYDRGELVPELGEEIVYSRLPFILIVVDELADLMMVAARDVEESINRIAAKARAVGVHLVIATQRPSVDVITGVIKANIPARWAFSVATATDSKVILGNGGAEKLVGKGDMLLLGPTAGSPERIQGCCVDESEAAKVVSHWRRQAPEIEFVKEVQGDDSNTSGSSSAGSSGSGDDDDLLVQAIELVVRSQFGSTSMLQRKLRVGFARAGRLMDLMEERGVVGPTTGAKAREVLMSVDELDLMGAPSGGLGDESDADEHDTAFDASSRDERSPAVSGGFGDPLPDLDDDI